MSGLQERAIISTHLVVYKRMHCIVLKLQMIQAPSQIRNCVSGIMKKKVKEVRIILALVPKNVNNTDYMGTHEALADHVIYFLPYNLQLHPVRLHQA